MNILQSFNDQDLKNILKDAIEFNVDSDFINLIRSELEARIDIDSSEKNKHCCLV